MNGAYGSRYHGYHRSGIDDTIRFGRLLDTLDIRGDGESYDSSSCLDRYHDHHCYHCYRRNDMGYFLD